MNDEKLYTIDEVHEILEETSQYITNIYFDKMEIRDIAVLIMFIYFFKDKLDEKKSEETALNE